MTLKNVSKELELGLSLYVLSFTIIVGLLKKGNNTPAYRSLWFRVAGEPAVVNEGEDPNNTVRTGDHH